MARLEIPQYLVGETLFAGCIEIFALALNLDPIFSFFPASLLPVKPVKMKCLGVLIAFGIIAMGKGVYRLKLKWQKIHLFYFHQA